MSSVSCLTSVSSGTVVIATSLGTLVGGVWSLSTVAVLVTWPLFTSAWVSV